MIPAKLAALCLCPALVATPIVVATHPKVRHAVAHLMHRAADRLEAPAAAAPTQFASAPCAPGLGIAGLGAGLAAPVLSAVEGSAVAPIALPLAVANLGRSDVPGLTPFNPGVGGSGFGGGSGSVTSDVGPGGASASGTPGLAPTPVAGVTEPQNWALLMTGFGATGVLLRTRRQLRRYR